MSLFRKKKTEDTGLEASENSELMKNIKKIREQLIFLERKVDILLGHSPYRKSSGKDFSGRHRRYGGRERQENQARGNG